MKGYRVRYTLATKLVNELVEAADEKQLNKTIAGYGRVDLLCIAELGYMGLDRHEAELLFPVLTEREEKNSVAIASNESFGGWTKTFTDPRLCAAIVDRPPSTAPSSRPGPIPTASPAPEPELKNPPRSADTGTHPTARCPSRAAGRPAPPFHNDTGSLSVARRAWSSTSKRTPSYSSFCRCWPSTAKPAARATPHEAGLFTRCPSSSRKSSASSKAQRATTQQAREAMPWPRAVAVVQ